jgi:hypothetical protein
MSNPSLRALREDADARPTLTATLIRDDLPRFSGHAAHYRLSVPLGEYYGDQRFTDVVVSTACVGGRDETYIFGADADGNVTNWGELPGSVKDCTDHAEALAGAGYTIVSSGRLETRDE